MTLSQQMRTGVFGNGGDWSYFAKNVKWIGRFIDANQLAAIGKIKAEVGKAGAVHGTAVGALAASAYLDLEIRGGIRAPHLHFDSKIFMLNEKQWAEFSQKIVADCQAKLAKVNAINFEDGMALGSILGGLTRS